MSLINTPPALTGYSSDNWSSYLAYLLSGGGSLGGSPTGTAGSPNAAVVTVQGVSGGTAVPTNDQSYAAHAPAYYQVSVTTTAQSLATLIATTVPTWATMAFVTPETGSIRYRADGTAPTSAVGQPIASGQSWPVQSAAALAAAQFIAAAATTVSIEFRG